MSGGYHDSVARSRDNSAVASVNTGPAVTSSTLCPVRTSQSSTESPPAGSTPSRLAANPATVATSTRCQRESSQVTGNRAGNPR